MHQCSYWKVARVLSYCSNWMQLVMPWTQADKQMCPSGVLLQVTAAVQCMLALSNVAVLTHVDARRTCSDA